MRKVLLRLLVLALAPILVVTLPSVSQAAGVVQTAGVEWDIGGLSIGGFGALECDATVTSETRSDSVQLMVAPLNCYGGPDASPGFAQPGEPGSTFTVWVEGSQCGGSAGGTFATGSDDSVMMVHGIGSAGFTAGPPTCDPAQMCLKVEGGGSIRQGCSPVNLDPTEPAAEPGTCQYIESMSVPQRDEPVITRVQASGPSLDAWTQTARSVIKMAAGQDVAGWRMYVVYTPLSGRNGVTPVTTNLGSWHVQTLGPKTGTPTEIGNEVSARWGWQGPVAPVTSQIVGVGLRPTMSTAQYGTNDRPNCHFYWGTKIHDDPNVQTDEPMGPLLGGSSTGVPVPDPYVPGDGVQEEGCQGFSWTDPASWASSAMCMVAALLLQVLDVLGDVLGWLGDIVGFLGGLVADLVGAFLDLLTDLFIPADGFLDAQLSGLKQDFKDTSPGAYVDAITGQSFGVSASGCGGIPASWSMAGESYSFNIGAACSGFMANVAGVVKLAASAMLVIFGGLACVRAVGAGFGWRQTLGKGADAA